MTVTPQPLAIQGGALVAPHNPPAPLLAPGTSAFKPQAPITFGTVPGLTAAYTKPASTTGPAPAVVTADAANNHIDTMTNATNTANSDIQNAAVAKANLAATAAANTPPAPATPAPAPQDYDSQINDIMSGLGTTLGTTPTDPNAAVNNQTIADDNTGIQLDQQNQQTVSDSLTQMENGTYPLPASQQAQVDDLKNTYASAINSATQYAQNLQAGTTAAQAGGEQPGLQYYSPQMALANIQSAIVTGAAKVGAANNDLLSAQAKLTQSLQDGDYKTASRLYTQISDDIKARSDEIDKINTYVQKQTDQMHTDALDVAKMQISALTSAATRDATAGYRAQQLILSTQRLTDSERKTMFDELHTNQAAGTAAERATQATSQFQSSFTQGQYDANGNYITGTGSQLPNGHATVDKNGYITPEAWKLAIADAPAEGLTREDFIKSFGSMVYNDNKNGIDARAYGLTPAELKLINGTS